MPNDCTLPEMQKKV